MKSKKYFIMILTLFCSVSITSCFTVGNQFPSTVVWIKANETTRSEIEKAYGPPFRVGYDSGMKTYSYGYYKYSAFSESQTKDLTIRFNSNDTVYSYTFSSSFPDDKK